MNQVASMNIASAAVSEASSIVDGRNHCALCPTRSVCTARDLEGPALDALADHINTTRVLQRNDYLYRVSDPAVSCYVIRSGVFKSVTVTPAGEEYITGFHYPGELVGLNGQMTGVHMDSTLALTASTACRLHVRDLRTLFAAGTDTALLRLIAEREARDLNLEINLRQSGAEARIAGFFVLLMRRQQHLGYQATTVPLPMSRTDLANYLGLTLECLSRVLGKWKRAGVISLTRSNAEVYRPAELNTLAHHLP
jgi:CRP/FNR family transcriptional regulator, anaerobic regulatory protein